MNEKIYMTTIYKQKHMASYNKNPKQMTTNSIKPPISIQIYLFIPK